MTIQLSDKVFTIVDDDVSDSVKDYIWRYNKATGYAFKGRYAGRRNGKGIRATDYLHRFILGVNDRHIDVDHINGDKLDNRKCNIRAVTRSQNQQNQQIHREGRPVGVHYQEGKITSKIIFAGKAHYLGFWQSEKKAGEVYQLAKTLLTDGFDPANIRSEVKRRFLD